MLPVYKIYEPLPFPHSSFRPFVLKGIYPHVHILLLNLALQLNKSPSLLHLDIDFESITQAPSLKCS